MRAQRASASFGSHSSAKLDSGTFLFLPGLSTGEAREACARSPNDTVQQLTIKAVGRFRPTVGTVVARTLHITLAREHFTALRRELASARDNNRRVTFEFDVDSEGDVTNLRFNDTEIDRLMNKTPRCET